MKLHTPSRPSSSRCPQAQTRVVMARRKKKKFRAREQCHQAPDYSETQRSHEAVAMDELPSCSSALEVPPQSQSETQPGSTSQAWGQDSDTVTSPGILDASSENGEESHEEEVSYSPEGFSAQSSDSPSPTVNVDVVEQFLLHKYRMNQSILKEDIEKILGETHQDEYAAILEKAAEHIELVFAIDLKEVDSTKHEYELVSKLKLPNNGRMRAGRGWPRTGLVMNILGFIFMKGNCAAEKDVWQFLKVLKVYAGRKHFIYGEPRKFVNNDLVKLKYLEYRQVPGSDPPRHEYLWGPRAYAETSKMKVLHFLAKVADTTPTAFPLQYEEALREERARGSRAGRAGTSVPAWPDSRAPSSSSQTAR
ncbi:melanoma-associated antigen B5-like [Rousettus aegyptiacus]|uniref:melanoma-associated antigen B5-like n=1 Tax=Rousettus aegyptiacus TaxID=9407 RepID=UPI00168D01B0|nr:melanoma-associated antigen B5-like [Rousettus aegyptiacus]